MFSTIFLARRNMRAHLGRTFLTLLGIILGVAVVLAIQVTNQTTLELIARRLRSHHRSGQSADCAD